MTNNRTDIATALADRLVEAGLLAAERRGEAHAIIARSLAPLTAGALRAVSVGYADIYTDAHEYGERVEEMMGAIDNLAACVSYTDSDLVFEGAVHLIDGRCGTTALLNAIEITAQRPSPRQAHDLRLLLGAGSVNALDLLVNTLHEIAGATTEPQIEPVDLAPFLDSPNRHVREAALLVLGRLRPEAGG